VWPSFLLLLCKRVPKLGRAVVLDALLENENAAWSARESETLLHAQRASARRMALFNEPSPKHTGTAGRGLLSTHLYECVSCRQP